MTLGAYAGSKLPKRLRGMAPALEVREKLVLRDPARNCNL